MKAQRLSLDRISTLPRAIIETILCLLPIEEAARTSILSRAWRYQWTTIPKVEFDWYTVSRRTIGEIDWKQTSKLEIAKIYKDIRCKLFYAIHQVLLLRQGPIIEFSLSMNANNSLFQINQIILHLARNHTVKKLTLDFSQSTTHGLPLCVFLLHHDLYLENCDINHKPIIGGFGPFSSITSLSLKLSGCRRISRETLLHILTTCPSLKRLCLLVYKESFRGYEKPSIVDLFKCLPVIEHLTISGHILSLLVQASVPEKPPPSLVHLKYLCIKELNFADDYGLTFLAVLIKCSPNLEKIKLVSDAIDHDEEGEAVKLREYSYVRLEHLNELEIKFFSNKKHEMELVKFILARSPGLKKVRLLTAMICKNEALEVLEILLRSPRASPIEIVAENLRHYQFYYY